MNIIVTGPPGSGKGTQAELMARELGISLFSAGDLLYYTGKEDTSRGRKIRELMDTGSLVEDKVVLQLVEEHLKGKEHQKGVVIDGFPRSLWQAQNFSFPVDKAIYLKVSDEVNKERLLKRGRKDDMPKIIDKRLKVYHRQTEPILDYYRQKGILMRIDGERPKKVIFEDLMARLGEDGRKNADTNQNP